MPLRPAAYPAACREQVIALARAGRSAKALAEEFEPSEQTIRNWIFQTEADHGERPGVLTTDERAELTRGSPRGWPSRQPEARRPPDAPRRGGRRLQAAWASAPAARGSGRGACAGSGQTRRSSDGAESAVGSRTSRISQRPPASCTWPSSSTSSVARDRVGDARHTAYHGGPRRTRHGRDAASRPRCGTPLGSRIAIPCIRVRAALPHARRPAVDGLAR